MSNKHLVCSFCGLPPADVVALVTGPRMASGAKPAICDRCARAAVALIAMRQPEASRAVDAPTVTSSFVELPVI